MYFADTILLELSYLPRKCGIQSDKHLVLLLDSKNRHCFYNSGQYPISDFCFWLAFDYVVLQGTLTWKQMCTDHYPCVTDTHQFIFRLFPVSLQLKTYLWNVPEIRDAECNTGRNVKNNQLQSYLLQPVSFFRGFFRKSNPKLTCTVQKTIVWLCFRLLDCFPIRTSRDTSLSILNRLTI